MPRLSKIGAAALAAFGWTSGSAVTVDFLVVAGGGGGATAFGAGGGAGGFRTSAGTSGGGASAEAKLSLNPTLSYTVIVGAGGNGALGSTQVGNTNGSDSSFSTITSTGGGAGGTNGSAGATGGSGGAGGNQGGISAAAGAGTANQGFAGGTGSGSSSYGSGGGGGAGAIGGTGTTSACGAGGVGVSSPISGTSTFYAGGGGGGATAVFGITTPGNGGNGGGGKGADSTNSWVGYSGEANKGGGGGGGGYVSSWLNGGQGGSGVVIISYVGAQQFGGGVVTSSGGNTIHTFTTSGTLSPLNSLTASYLIVAGGGGGAATFGGGYGGGGGGGAGGLLSGSGVTIDTNSIYAVTVGASGAGGASAGAVGTNGGNSTFSMVTTTAVGGGGGASYPGASGVGNGGSGGGVGYGGGTIASGGTGIAGQGFAGGGKVSAGSGGGGGAGSVGGAGSAGGSGTFPETGGNGGTGLQNPITGSTTGQLSGGIYYVAGGGGGGGYENGGNGLNGGTASAGGGAGGGSAVAGSAGTASTGGGGGGGGGANLGTHYNGGNGGSGVVIISYAGSVQQMAGGTVTVAGGNVIHTFTSSGYLTPIVLANNSLRFRASANAYLNRTPSNGNKRVFTWSGWIKRGIFGTQSELFVADINSAYGGFHLQFNTNNKLYVYQLSASASEFLLVTTAVYRDPSAWYHVVLAVDTNNATENNRVRLYVNGTEVTAFDSRQNPTTGLDTYVNNSSYINYIGTGKTAIEGFRGYFDGYLADVNFIDGQALTPNSFGTFNGLGVWQPIRYGGSYGTNGFYLPFNAGTLTYAGSFNGSNQYLTVPDSSVWAFSGNWTVEAFFYVTTTSPTYQAIVAQWVDGGGTDRAFSIAVDSSARLTAYAQYGGNQYNPVSASSTIKTNQWYHTALVVNGSTLTLYLNGVAISSATITGTINNSTAPVGIGAYGNNNWQISGGISNVRITNTAVYTSNFTVPSANLTAVSGTQLLTCQNATFVDNSTNAFTITNNNGTTITQNYPFSASRIFNDQSPQGNNWTPNNISSVSGSTLDYMTDVPTLTSATVANYCVLNTLDKSGTTYTPTISNGNLSFAAGSTGQFSPCRGTQFVSSGKWYFETTITNNGTYSGQVGVANNYNIYQSGGDNSVSSSGGVGAAWDGRGFLYYTGNNTAFTPTFTTNDVISCAFDADTGKIWFRKNGGSWYDSSGGTTGDPATGANAVYTYTAGTSVAPFVNGVSPHTQAANFGQQPFSYTPPSGFLQLNTFNLPTPAIGATPATTANKYFNANLYTGNGTTNAITNVGFQPDFVWVKSISDSYFHGLYDAVRGAGSTKGIYSNDPVAEGTYSDYQNLVSFDSNGFTLGATSNTNNINANTSTFVGWNWKANGAGSTNTAGSIISTVSSNTATGFSIVTYTGNATSGATVGHGCQVNSIATAPSMVILKSRSLGTNFYVYHSGLTSAAYQVYLNLPSQQDNSVTTAFNSVAPGDTTFTLPGTGFGSNNSGATYVAYCFAQVAGYSAFGTYIGNNDDNGPFIYTGFRPRWVMVKNRTSSQSWQLMDTSRSTYNVATANLLPNSSTLQLTGTDFIDILSNGFKIRRNSAGNWNNSGDTYLYVCFAENPFKYANAR
jgi:hypothetical protein